MAETARTLAAHADYLIEVAHRAPSLHNTQPWRFTVAENAIDLRADPSRQLRVDPDGREMVISCGAALFGLRLAVRSLGYQPVVELLPERRVLARVGLGPAAPMTAEERVMLIAVPHRHTHRGPFESDPLPAGLLGRLRDDARIESAKLIVVDAGPAYQELVSIAAAASHRQDRDRAARAETRRWSREAGSQAREGVPAHAYPAVPGREAERLPQRDFDLGRGFGALTADGPAPPVTAALLTPCDGKRDWLRAGQALHRLLLRAASQWVFAGLNTQPLEDVTARKQVKDCLARPGWPQMLLTLGVSRTAHPTARRPVADLTGP